ncbi:polymorphic toxin-type HINT domain-containing protein [Streptomyces fulvoviolaceus]|uniref:polymorphic toxin-type HINT domain-containing protein n=1 Tax=Streptomyces fulvoviolaceus TaxID=285535 RepID=UPI003B835455
MGSAPSLGMTYNSQSVDGRTSATNNQASWVGMGWDLNVGYIERRYRNCTQDGLDTIGDMCWDSPNTADEPDGAVYVINLNGVTSTLVQDNTGTGSYHLHDNPGWRVQHLSGGYGADDEYWVISTQDGKRYYFGWGRSERTVGATASVFTVPVVGNNTGEPCHAQFPEPCTQAWRWNLDRTVDANEVEATYFYDKETNYYRSVANTDKARSYTSGGYLRDIQYGWPTQIANSKPTGRVQLSHVGRCVERMADTDPLRSEPDACPSMASSPSSYPDVPIDLLCDGSSADYYCAGKTYYPTFFSKDMLWDIKTSVLNTTADGWDLVQQYQTKHGLPNPDGAIGKTLWLDYVQRKTYGTGTDIVLPVINFNGVDLDNKVGSTELNFRRLSTIHGDLGATTTVTYGSPNACSEDSLPSQSSNTKDCYWQKWTPEGETESKTGWFKKFLVTKVTVDPTVTSSQDGAPEMTTSYDYQGGAGWRFTNDPLTPDEDESWSDWRGYQRVEVTSGSGTVKHSTFHWLYRGLDGDRTSKTDSSATRTVLVTDGEGTSYTDSPWLQGRTIETSTRDDAGSSHERVFHSYWSHNTAQYEGLRDARFVREDETTTQTKISTGWRTHVVQNEYDATTATSATYGLPLRTDDQGEAAVSDNRCTTYGRAYNTDLYEDGKIQRWTVLTDETRHYAKGCTDRAADNQDSYAVTLYDYATDLTGNKPTDGNPTESRVYTSADKYQKARSGYDDAGRVTWSEDANLRRTTTTYSPANTWPLDGITTTTAAPGPFKDPLTSTVWISRFWGAPYQSKDINGAVTKVTLDAAGRLTEAWLPTETGSSPSLKFDYSIPTSTSSGIPDSVSGYPRVGSHTLQSGATYLSSYSYTDGLGRTRETQASIPDGVDASTGAQVPNRRVAVTRYDTAGNVTGTSAVFRNQGTAGSGSPVSPKVEDLPSYTDLTLDWAGRPTVSQILVGDGSTTTTSLYGRVVTSYAGDYTTVIPQVGGATDTYTDVYGQTAKVVGHNGSSTFTTQYGYTATGALSKITDPRGNDTIYTYDWAGQRTKSDDPDAGVSTTEYDSNGRITNITSNGGKTVLSYDYDNLGRQTSVSSGSDELASWTWDGTSVPGGKGQITSTTSKDADGNTYTVKTNEFDSRGRPLSTTVSIPANVNGLAGDYTTEYTYDAADHVTSVSYPAAGGLDAETVTATYDGYGQPGRLASNRDTYVKSSEYDAYGRLTARTYGLTTVLGAVAHRTYTYNDSNGTRWLQGIATTVTPPGASLSEVQKDTYSYDFDGKITELREQATGQTAQSQCFRYDDQARLTNAYTRSSAGACALGSTSDFTGTAPYQSAYGYDRLGNLQSVTDTDSTGKATARDYLYPGYDDAGTWTTANADWPHGVRKINTITAGTTTGSETLTYDAAGQMDTRVESGTTTTSTDYDWNKLGRLATVKTTKSSGSELTRYTYDADGNLLVRTTPQETVASIGGMELRTTNGTTVTATRYYTSGSATVAMRTTEGNSAANGKVTYLMGDTQASTQLAVDAATGTSTRRRYTPFGDERSGSLPTGTDSGFLGKTEDTSTGLSLLGARAYDPHLARFLSPDPISTPYDPQNLSAYSYSGNDPINYSDPSGLIRENPDGTECTDGWDECGPGDVTSQGGEEDTPDIPTTSTDPGTDCSQYGYMVRDACLAQPYTEDHDNTGFWAGVVGTAMTVVAFSACETAAAGAAGPTGGASLLATGACWGAAGAAGAATSDALDGDEESTTEALTNQGEGAALGVLTGAVSRAAKALRAQAAGQCLNSFPPQEDVRMADGSTKSIKDVKTGDEVLATDPETGQTEARTVLATIITKDDKDFADLTVKTRNGEFQIIATAHHPFWSPSKHTWINAGDLDRGMTLRTDSGPEVTVTSNRAFHEKHETRNLTVDGLHTYYVLAGETPVLVHNSGGCPDLDALSQSGMRPAKGNTTHAGREYQKHMNRGDLPVVPGKQLKSAGQDLLDDILTNPKTATSPVNSGNFAGGTRYIMPDPTGGRGIGATFDANGQFQYFGRY